ncbi:MAG: septal ring lytic transglycosylase RlpA family protein [Betaproteobacteria bacterium]|nr:septal ring lytic transglycosylase RlpA family protein [Betaproteobacteria bacterium]
MSLTRATRLAAVSAATMAMLAGCGAPAPRRMSIVEASKPAPPQVAAPVTTQALPPPISASLPTPTPRGHFYLDDGPADAPSPNLEHLPNPEPRSEPLHRFANNPYSALGQDFVPERAVRPLRQQGFASWYGRRFHGNKTATGEIYDMFGLSAAHPTLALPSYAKVTNTQNGRQIIVRVNDRGPFLRNRIMDLSYAAAVKLGYMEQGVAPIEVEVIVPNEADYPAGAPAPLGGPERAVAPVPNLKGFPLFVENAGVFVQIGAFLVPENAEVLRARMSLELSSVIRSMQVVPRNGMHRLWVGPYKTQQEARLAADRIAAQFR